MSTENQTQENQSTLSGLFGDGVHVGSGLVVVHSSERETGAGVGDGEGERELVTRIGQAVGADHDDGIKMMGCGAMHLAFSGSQYNLGHGWVCG